MRYGLTALIAAGLCLAGWLFDRAMQRRYGHDCSWLCGEECGR